VIWKVIRKLHEMNDVGIVAEIRIVTKKTDETDDVGEVEVDSY
jgi:hypothetical protein